jgi:CRP/FNR family transcriptional regulator, anaerobic regulatory protein
MLPVTALPEDPPANRDAWFARRCAVIPAAAVPLRELLHAIGADSDAQVPEAPFAIPVWRVRSGAALLHEGARPDAVHVVRSGTFKCLKTSEDGYEQVLSFAGQGEILGFESTWRGLQLTSAIALEESTVCSLPLRELDLWRQLSPALDHALQFALGRQLARAGEIAEMMAAVAAEVRLARFLVWLSGCMAEHGQSPRRLYLRMSRRDIASLLAVAHETVSRSFSTLVELGLLQVNNREVEILDPAGLRACTRSTRGLPDELPRVAPGRHRAAPRLNVVAA